MICTPEALAKNATATGFMNLSVKQLWGVEGYLDCQIANNNSGGPWSPTNPGPGITLIEWLKADGLAAGVISTWPATTGLAVNTNGKDTPLVVANAQNGLPVVRFDGVDDGLSSAAFGSQIAQPYTCAIAFKYNGVTSAITTIAGGISVQVRLIWTANPNFDMAANTAVSTGVAVDNNFHLAFLVYNGASSKFAFDGAALTTLSSTPGTNALDGIGVGYFAATNSVFSQVDIGELLVWSGDGTSFASQAYTYLFNRWH